MIINLLAEGVDVNVKDHGETKATALHWVAGNSEREDVVKLLLDAGADPLIKDSDNLTAIDWAKKNDHPKVQQLMQEHVLQKTKKSGVKLAVGISDFKKIREEGENLLGLMRPFMSSAFKDNSHLLHKGVIMGILRIAQASIFSGLNNLAVHSILSSRYTDHFGFLDAEVDLLLQTFNAVEHKKTISAWYNGYQAGKSTIISLVHPVN